MEHKIRTGEDHGPADKEFHAYVARCTHNSVITEIMPVITYSIEMFTKFKAPRLLKDTIRTHWQITEAICANDPQKRTIACMSMCPKTARASRSCGA